MQIREKLNNLEEFISGFCIFLIPIMLFLQLIFKSMDIGFPWFEEILRFSFLLLVYSASVIGIKTDSHFALTFLVDKFPRNLYIVAVIIKYAVWYLLNIIIIYQSILYIHQLTIRPQTSPVLEINMAWIYSIIPIAFLLQTIRLTNLIIKKIREKA